MRCESFLDALYIRVCLFPSVLRNSLTSSLPTNISHVLAVSLHTACLTKPFRVLYLFPYTFSPHSSLLLPPHGNISSGKSRRCEEVQKASTVFPYGLASAELLTHKHMLEIEMQVNTLSLSLPGRATFYTHSACKKPWWFQMCIIVTFVRLMEFFYFLFFDILGNVVL